LKIHLIIILPAMLRSSKWFSPSGLPIETLYEPLLCPVRGKYPAYVILLDLFTRRVLGEEYRTQSSSLCSLLHSLATSSPLRPNILLSILFSYILSFYSSVIVSDQVGHPHKKIGKIICLYILIFIFFNSLLEDKGSAPINSKNSMT
jgi:hypothetical protein